MLRERESSKHVIKGEALSEASTLSAQCVCARCALCAVLHMVDVAVQDRQDVCSHDDDAPQYKQVAPLMHCTPTRSAYC